MIFNTLPYVSLYIWNPQHNLPYLTLETACNISCTTLMNLSYNREIKTQIKWDPTAMFLQSRQCIYIKNQECSNLVHTYCDTDHAKDISDIHSFTSIDHLFNGTVFDWYNKKQPDIYRSSSNEEIISWINQETIPQTSSSKW